MARLFIKTHHAKPLEKKPTVSLRRKQMEKILAVWEKFPGLRLGQLLINAVNQPDPFYVTDEVLVEKVMEYGETHEEKPSSVVSNERTFPRECC